MSLTERDPTPLATMQRFLEADGEAAVEDLVEDLVDEVDWDDYNPPLFRQEYGRLIRSPLKKKGHVILDTCQSDGHLTRSVLSKSEVWQVPTLYSALRKLRWGGIVPVLPLQQQQHSGPLADAHKHFISDELHPNPEDGKETGFTPSSFVGQSPMSKKSAAMDPPVKVVVPPPVTVGRRSPIWKEGEGLKKNDRNRNYQGLGGLVMDEDRGYGDNTIFQETAEMSELYDTDMESRHVESAKKDRKEIEQSPWDEEDEDDVFGDDEDNDISPAKMERMSRELNNAISRLKKGDLPLPEDVGKERFFPDDVYDEDDDEANDDDAQFGDVNHSSREGSGDMSAADLADMDILKQLRQHHSLDSLNDTELGEGGEIKNIEWDKVFADLQKDGAFDDIDMSALEELESKMQGSNWDDFKGDDDDEMNGHLEGGNGLDMEAFAKMLQSDLGGGEGMELEAPKPARRRQKRTTFEYDDDDEEEWQRGVQGKT